jgi:hypothetical protein
VGHEVFPDRGVLDAEPAANLCERQPLLVETDRFVDLCGGQDALAAFNTVAIKNHPNRPAVDAELTSELQHVATRLVLGDQVGLFRFGEVALGLKGPGWLNVPIIRVELTRVALRRHCQLEQSEGDFRRFASAIYQIACDV